MKISNNALNFLLAQYRAIFKRAYVKGLASAVIMTAGLAAGSAQAVDNTAGLDSGNYYFYDISSSLWKEVKNGDSGAVSATDGIVAGQIGGNGLSGANIDPEQNLTTVTGGKLTIDGVGGKNGSLKYVQSGTVAGGWAQLSNADSGTITASGNSVDITGSGMVTKDGSTTADTRGVVFGAFAQAKAGKAIARDNTVKIKRTENLTTAAASHGIYGAQAFGNLGAQAIHNIVTVDGTDKAKQTLAFLSGNGVYGGAAVASGASSTGTYEAYDNEIHLTNVSGTAAGTDKAYLNILGSHINLNSSKANAKAGNTTVVIDKSDLAAVSGGAIAAINVQDGSGSVVVDGNNTGLTISNTSLTNSSGAVDNTLVLALAGTRIDINDAGTAKVEDSVVTIENTSITDEADASNTVLINGASINNSGASATATGNKVVITEEASNYDKKADTYKRTIDASITGATVDNGNTSGATFNLSNNSVEIGSNVKVKGNVMGAYLKAQDDKIESLVAQNNSVTVAGEVVGDVRAVTLASGSTTASGTMSFLNNDVTLKAGAKVQSGSLVGGSGKDSAIVIENGATYLANNGSTQHLTSDVINIAGNVEVTDGNTLTIQGFFKDGKDGATSFHDNLTSIASSAVIKNAETINIYGKAVVDQGATLTGTVQDNKIVVDASKGISNPNESLLTQENEVTGAGQGTLALYNSTLKSYLTADKIGSATTNDSEGMVQLTSGGALELRDTTNIDLATEFNFNTTATAGSIVVDDATSSDKGSIIRGNELTVSRKLATNAVTTSATEKATTYSGLSGATTAGIKLEANVLHLGSNTLQSWQSEELTFAEATFRDQLTFAAVNNGKKGTDDKNNEKDIVNDGYHLVSSVIGDHYKKVMEQSQTDANVEVAYYQAQNGVIEGDVIITKADSGSLTIRNGNYSADDSITIASGGTLSVGGDDGIAENSIDATKAPDATLTLGQALTFDLNVAGSGTVTVTGAQTDRYDAEAAAETLGDDRHVMLDLRKGITLKGAGTNHDQIQGAAKLEVTSGGEILLTADTVNSLLAQNHNLNDASGSFLTASSGGAFVVEGDIDATFDDFNGSGSTHGITLKDGGYLVADSLTIDNAESVQDKVLDENDSNNFKPQSVDWGKDGTVAVQDLEISDLQLTNGESKPAGANDYASYVTLAQGTAEIGSSLLSYNHTLKLGSDTTSGNLVFFAGDEAAEGTITVDNIEVNQGSVAAYNGKWDGSNTNLTLSGANTKLTVGDNTDDEDEEYNTSLTLNDITLTGENTSVSVTKDGSLKAHKLTAGASTSSLSIAAGGEAEFDQVDFSALTTPSEGSPAPVTVNGYLKINGDEQATIVQGQGTADDPHNGVALAQDGAIAIGKNGTLEFGLAAVNGAILDTTNTTRFSGADSIKLDDENYGAITNQGGTLKLDFGSGTVFDEAAIKDLKSKLFTAGSLDADGVLVQGGMLHINDATFEYLDGKLTQLSGAGLDGWTAEWSQVKEFSDIYGNDLGSNQTLQTNISGIKVDDQVKGNWGSLSMVANVSDKAQVTLVGHTTLNYAAGNNGFFISDANRQTALGAKVDGNRILKLVDGGEIGSISLHAANGDYEQETVLEVTSSAEGTGALTTIAEIKGYGTASTNGVYGGTIANFRADTEVTGDIVGIDEVTAFTGTNVSVQNTTAVGELDTENAKITVAQKAQFGTAYVFGGSITAQDAEMKAGLSSSNEIVVAHNGRFKVVDTLTAHEGAAIRVGIDTSRYSEEDLTLEDGTVIGGTGYFEVGTLELNGGRLVVDPEYTEATAIATVGKFKDGSKQSDKYVNDKGILNGDLLIGKNAAFGLGATVAETQAAIADFQVGTALDPEQYGSILYLNGQLDVTAGSHIALNSSDTITKEEEILNANVYNVADENAQAGSVASDRYAALGLGKNTAIIMTDKAFEDNKGEKTGTAIYFDRTNAVVNGQGGEILLAGDFDLSDSLNIFEDKDAEGQKGVTVKGSIKVKTLNGFLYTILEGDNQGYGVSLDVDKEHAHSIMSEASDPVVATLIEYATGVTGSDADSGADNDADSGADQGGAADAGQGEAQGQQLAQNRATPEPSAEQGTEQGATGESTPEDETPAPTAEKSTFLNAVVTNTHGAPAEQAARFGVYGGTAQVGLAAANSNADVLAARFGIGANAQSLNVASNGMGGTLWVAPIYKSQDSDGFAAQGLNYGVDFDLYGVALGGDYKVTNNVTVGAMFNVGSGDLDGQGNSAAGGVSNDFDYFGFALYGAYQAGPLTVSADLSYTQVDNDLEGNNGLSKLTASADTSAWSLGVTGQYAFSFAAVDVTPHAGLRFTSLDLDDYTVNSADYGTVASFDSDTMSVFSIPVGITFAKTIQGESWTVTPALDLHVAGQFGDDEAEGSVAWSGTGLKTNVTSEVFDNFTYGATVGIEAQSTAGFSFGLGLGYTGSSNTDEFSAQANARFTF